MTVPLGGFGFQVWFIGLVWNADLFRNRGGRTVNNTFSNRGI